MSSPVLTAVVVTATAAAAVVGQDPFTAAVSLGGKSKSSIDSERERERARESLLRGCCESACVRACARARELLTLKLAC